MTHLTLYTLCGLSLFGIGLYGTIFCRNLLRKVIGINLMSAGVFLVLIAQAARTPEGPPDPVPHAMVLTGVVVAVSASALMLALIRRLHRVTGRTELPSGDGE